MGVADVDALQPGEEPAGAVVAVGGHRDEVAVLEARAAGVTEAGAAARRAPASAGPHQPS